LWGLGLCQALSLSPTFSCSFYSKLAKRFYGPFQIIECVGQVVYHLNLPLNSKFHPIFHWYVLKPHQGLLPSKQDEFPTFAFEKNPLIEPLGLLEAKLDHSKIPPNQAHFGLVAWVGTRGHHLVMFG